MDSVIFDTMATDNGFTIGVATLNQPKVLNALSYEMARALQQKMQDWKQDDCIVAVILKGAGGKAFCAGGDLHALYASMCENTDGEAWNNRYAREFFECEYRLDYDIHTYPKPVICYGDGIVMGGGMGLMMGASHRVLTETTRMAMPEITIGLFPDSGATWMFNRLPSKVGKFLAATGAQLSASDALFVGLGDYFIDRDHWETVLMMLKKAPWGSSQKREYNDALISDVLASYPAQSVPRVGPLQTHYAHIHALSQYTDPERQYQAYADLANHEDEWLARSAQTLLKGAPISFALAMDLLKKMRHASLADVFRLEYNVAINCAKRGQFQEGIRALLVDKDKNPQWVPLALSAITREQIDGFYADPMPSGLPHPLANLV